MSATNRGGERDKLDRYYTPDNVARACTARLTIPDGATVLEPSVGGGAFVRAVLAATNGTADHPKGPPMPTPSGRITRQPTGQAHLLPGDSP